MERIKRAKAFLENHSRLNYVYLLPLWALRVFTCKYNPLYPLNFYQKK